MASEQQRWYISSNRCTSVTIGKKPLCNLKQGMASKIIPRYIEIDGLRLAEAYLPEGVRSASNFKPSADDIFVTTYVKCGTTWMCQIVKLILEKGQYTEMSPEEYFKCFPFLEYCGEEGVRSMSKPGCIKTHLSFDRLNFSDDAKYIYVTRHPSDCVVSFYHHTRFFPIYRFTDGAFDDFFDLFVEGKVDYNDYFDNLLSWYEQRHHPNILFLTYESMKADTRGTVLKVAEFLGCELTDTQVDNVLKFSSFEYMKQETNEIFKEISATDETNPSYENFHKNLQKALDDGHRSVGSFVRKGVVGEGKIMLSAEQKKRLRERIIEKTRGSDVMSLWANDF